LDYPIAEQPQPRKRRRRPIWLSVVAAVLVLAFWGGLVYAGFYYTKEYIDRSLREVEETNALQIQTLERRLAVMHSEMEAIEQALKETDKTLSKSDLTQKALNERIEALDDQLKRLERSLNVLKEAPDAGS